MPWLLLFLAGLLEVCWAFAMKQSDGFTQPLPTVIMVITIIGSLTFLALAMRALPLGTSYMVWTGIGAVGAFFVGVVFLGEALTPMRVFAAGLIVSGIAVMRFST